MSGYSKSFNLTNIAGQGGWFVTTMGGLLRAFLTNCTPQCRIAYALIAFIIGIQGFHPLAVYADAINLIPNPSVESADAAGTLPLSWITYKEGTNTTTFTYKTNEGHTGSKSLYVSMANFQSGYALWFVTNVAVKPNTIYTYSEFYRSNVATEIDMVTTNTSNQQSVSVLASPAVSATAWQQVTKTFTTPANVTQVSIYHLIHQAGWLQTDDFSLVESTPPVSNTIPNPSVETLASGGNPTDWTFTTYGTNNATSSVLNTGHTGNHSIKTSVSSTGYQDGGAYWSYTPQSVIGGKHYLYTDWYQSDVDTEVDAIITMSDGTVGSYYLGAALASPTGWSQVQGEIDVPANAVSITVYHLLYSPGYLITDDFSFAPFTPTPFNRGLVSITFDDGYTDQYTKALPILTSLGLKATFYIISSELTDQPTSMTAAQIQDLYSKGMEIGSHTITHPDMTTLSPSDLTTEMTQSRDDLAAVIGAAIPDFAYPLGAYNSNTITVGKLYYQSQRTTDNGFNTKDFLKQSDGSYDFSQLKVQSVDNGVTPAQVKAWIDQAKSQKTWLILVYHQIEDTNPTGDLYTALTSDLNQELQYIQSSGIGVVTVDQAIQEVRGQ